MLLAEAVCGGGIRLDATVTSQCSDTAANDFEMMALPQLRTHTSGLPGSRQRQGYGAA